MEKKFATSIIEGNKLAFELFYKAEYRNLCYFIASFIKSSQAQIEDVAQESFFALWKSRHAIDPALNIRAYLYTIAKNKTINVLKYNSRFSGTAVESVELEFYISTLESSDIISYIDSLDMERVIEKTIDTLKGKVRESFVLSRKYELTYKQIAVELGVSEKSVERYISTALKILREKLSYYLGVLLVILLF